MKENHRKRGKSYAKFIWFLQLNFKHKKRKIIQI